MDGQGVSYDPLLLPDMEAAVYRLRQAIQRGELIAVYGDFDVDGLTASAILIEGLRTLGGRVISYTPDRFTEGYGVHAAAIDALYSEGVTLVVTADCGTSSVREAQQARRLGIDMIVLDHHSVPPELPSVAALVNPRRPDNRYPDPDLASGGIAFKTMAALHELMGRPWREERYLDLVALSTICDMAPLLDENRSLVKRGLAALSRTQRPGLRALIDTAGLNPQRMGTDAVGYVIGPRLNAAGRLEHGRLALELLLEEDVDRALERARHLTSLNQRRQEITAGALDIARRLLDEQDEDLPLIFVGHEEIPSGVVGLVAGRLVEEFYRPAVVYERGPTASRASCRSIPEFDIAAALRNCGELMIRFGGHRAAAGFTAQNDRLPALREALSKQAEGALSAVELTPVIDIDAAVPLHRVNGKLVREIWALAPFGVGNPEPTFLSRGLEVVEVRGVGEEGAHLRLRLRDAFKRGATWPAVAFGQGDLKIREGERWDVIYTFLADRGFDNSLELRVLDAAPSETNAS
jgi:single-stranded-DNA-specific exonuclease